ncbi:MAG TPA: hypothetical protein PLQ61_06840 [Bacteroidales bacterium]|nr:hypothetical protein [Petrotogaceae bacterium]HQJ20893.1 hypothetical protein [Bacteroidales bacterium]
MSNFSILDENGAVVTEGDFGYDDPGAVKALTLQCQNISGKNLTGVECYPFPDAINSAYENNVNTPIAGYEIIKQTERGVKQVTHLAKEDVGAGLTAVTDRVKCLEYIGGVWTVRDTGAVNFPAAPGDKTYLLFDEKVLNIYFNPGTAGNYSTLNIKTYNGTSWGIPAGLTDGTSKLSAEGYISITPTDASTWEKVQIQDTTNNMTYWGYAYEISSPDASPTQAVSTSDGFHGAYVYDLPKCFIKGTGEYWLKSDGESPAYTEITETVAFEYANMGRVIFPSDPLSVHPTYTIVCDIYYKNPQPGSYVIDVIDANTVTVTKDGGTPSANITVLTGINPSTGLYYKNSNIVNGVYISLNALTAGDQGTIPISDFLKYLWISSDNSTFYNSDLEIGSIDNNVSTTVYLKAIPPLSAIESENEWDAEFYISGT